MSIPLLQNFDPQFKAGSASIDTVGEYRFLEVTTDNDLRFTSHIQNLVVKGKKRVKIIKFLSTKDWESSLEQQR